MELVEVIVIGQQISHYRILEHIGSGGMGEVYLAEDMTLERKVAIKILSEALARDELAPKRFQREAKSAAALDHPYICHIHEVGEARGQQFIAMEYVEGETLRDRLLRGRLVASEALRLAVEIGEALEVAHAKGIIHRDLKPANIMLTPQGHAKLMDFGLAKRIPAGEDHEGEITSALTREGSTLGTLYYMSPEQIRAEVVDARSDLFSYGIILYEMLTGVHPFRRPTAGETIGAILKEEPAKLSDHAEGIPEAVQGILDNLLAKDRDRRWPSIREVRASLARLISSESSGSWVPASPQSRNKWTLWAVAGVVGLLAITLLVWSPWSETPVSPPSRPVPLTSYPGWESEPAISPDGKNVAFVWSGENEKNFDIYVKLIGAEEATRLTTDPAEDSWPAWSPDSSQIVFFRKVSDVKHDVILRPVLGGSETKVTESFFKESGVGSGGLSWSPAEQVIAMVDRMSEEETENKIVLFSLETKEKRRLTSLQGSAWEEWPRFSPDGSAVAFYRIGLDRNRVEICVQNVQGGEMKSIFSTSEFVRGLDWTADGQSIVFSLSKMMGQDSYLMRVPVSGGMTERLSFGEGAQQLSIAREGGRLAYDEMQVDSDIWRTWGPASTEKTPPARFAASSTRNESMPLYSPDGTKIAFLSDRSGNQATWVCDSEGRDHRKLTGQGSAWVGDWSPIGDQLLLCAGDEDGQDIFILDVDDERIRPLTSDHHLNALPSWSPDGGWVYYQSNQNGWRIFRVPAEGGPVEQVSEKEGWLPRVAQDGRVFYWRDQKIWALSGEDGKEELILDRRIPTWCLWSFWGEKIVYVNETEEGNLSIEVFDLNDGTTEELQTLEKGGIVRNGFSVSPDGRWILYSRVEVTLDLMMVENFR